MRLALATLAVGAFTLGCGDASGPGGFAGTYALKSVNGVKVPMVVVQVGNDKVEITAGSVRLNGDMTFTASLTAKVTTGGSSTTDTETSTGTWAATGNVVTFTDSDGSKTTGTISGNTLTVTDTEEGVSITLVFQK